MLPHAEDFEQKWIFDICLLKLTEFYHKTLNICVITVLNVSSEEIKVNQIFHVVAGLGSDVAS